MRLHRSKRLQDAWYTLPGEVRGFVNALKTNHRPDGARAIPERPGYFEDFISGFWIGWTIDHSGSESVLLVTIREES